MTQPIIGVDLDNTLADYEPVFGPAGKRALRDAIRALPGGEAKWRGLQACTYGPLMGRARLAPGVRNFFAECRRRGMSVHVVSHRRRRYPLDKTVTDFRAAAMRWMRKNRFFDSQGLGLRPEAVHFAATRRGKIRIVRELDCRCFIDDLEETFQGLGFPESVGKILYSPKNGSRRLKGVRIARGWDEVAKFIFEDERIVGCLLGDEVTSLRPIGSGRNSRVCAAVTGSGRRYVAKFYFRHPTDARNRLAAEYGALRFLWDQGVRQIPRPMAADSRKACAVYGFVAGGPIKKVRSQDIDEAVAFLLKLKSLACRWPEKRPASEACFSPQAIVKNIRRRLSRLQDVGCRGRASEERELRGFLSREFAPRLREVLKWCSRGLAAEGWSWDRVLPRHERTLSPSDFGFHNALRCRDGSIKFLDFEYFGWDDPAKMTVDFLLHPAMRLSPAARRRFLARLLAGWGKSACLRRRIEIVYPLYGLKWCLILLNEFAPEHRMRREFASAGSGDVRRRQLGRARRMLRHVIREYQRFLHHG